MTDNRPRSIGELLDAAVTLSVRHAPLLGAIAAFLVVPSLATTLLTWAAPSAASMPKNPGFGLAYSSMLFLLGVAILLLSVVSQIAIAAAVYDILHGVVPRLSGALKTGFGALFPAIGVYLRYTLALVFFGGIFLLSLAGIASRNPVYVVLGIAGVAAILVPLGLTVLAADVGVIHRALKARDPGSQHFEGGLAAFSTEGRNILAAITVLALNYSGFYVVKLLSLALPIPAVVAAVLQQCVDLVASIVGSTFLTLFYLDLRTRSTGADLAQTAAALRQEATTAAAD